MESNKKAEGMGVSEATQAPAIDTVPTTNGAAAVAVAVETASDDASASREQRRSRRKRPVRARTISVKRMTKRELEIGRLLYPEADHERPRTRVECGDAPRPCPYVSCKHHLYLDVSARTGAIKLNFPDLEVWEMADTCALDVADRGGTTLEEVGAIMNLTRERIRQVEVKALAKLDAMQDMLALRDYVDEGPVGKRRLPVLSKKERLECDDEDEEERDSEERDEDDLDDEDREEECEEHEARCASGDNQAEQEAELEDPDDEEDQDDLRSAPANVDDAGEEDAGDEGATGTRAATDLRPRAVGEKVSPPFEVFED